uniref:G-protein coupled receptors family 1 profile domain-containing protein n=1 Tax=Pelusios castaneus TaxID=367368 RepID=A0A8C8RYM2_9SAUR
MPMENQTIVTEFILLGLSSDPQMQIFLFLVFLVIYLITLFGNIVIMVVIRTDSHLHTPMYFLLFHLSFVDIWYSSITVPKMLIDFLAEHKTISFNGCIAQMFFFFLLAGSEVFILSAMAHDRYVAICDPFHYVEAMNKEIWFQLVSGAWTNALLMSRLIFCGPNELDHFFCDLTPLIKLSCSDTNNMELVTFWGSVLFTLPPFLLTIASYVYIIRAILRIPSADGKQKAFSTCSSHLIVVTIFYGTLIIVYLLPKSKVLQELNKVFSLCYTVLTPLLNPLIYSLRNKEVKGALRKVIRKGVLYFAQSG